MSKISEYQDVNIVIADYLLTVVKAKYPDLIDDKFQDVLNFLDNNNEEAMADDLRDMLAIGNNILPYYVICNNIKRLKEKVQLLVNTDNSNVNSTLTSLTNRIDSLEMLQSTQGSDISSISSSLSSIQSTQTTSSNRLQIIESTSIPSLVSEIQSLDSSVDNMSSQVSQLSTDISNFNSAIAGLSQANSALYDLINARTDINGQVLKPLVDRIKALELSNQSFNSQYPIDIDAYLSDSKTIDTLKSNSNQVVNLNEQLNLFGESLNGIWLPTWSKNNLGYAYWAYPHLIDNGQIDKVNYDVPQLYGDDRFTSVRDDGWISSTSYLSGKIRVFIGLQADPVFMKTVSPVRGNIDIRFVTFNVGTPTLLNNAIATEVQQSMILSTKYSPLNEPISLDYTDPIDNYIIIPSLVKQTKNTYQEVTALNSRFRPFSASRLIQMPNHAGNAMITPTLVSQNQLDITKTLYISNITSRNRIFSEEDKTETLSDTDYDNWTKIVSIDRTTSAPIMDTEIWKKSVSKDNVLYIDAFTQQLTVNSLTGTEVYTFNLFTDNSDSNYNTMDTFVNPDGLNYPISLSGPQVDASWQITKRTQLVRKAINKQILKTVSIDLSLENKYRIGNDIVIEIRTNIYNPDVMSYGVEILLDMSLTNSTADYLNIKNSYGMEIRGNIIFNTSLMIPPIGYVTANSYFVTRWYDLMKDTYRQFDLIYQRLNTIESIVNSLIQSLTASSRSSASSALQILSIVVGISETLLSVVFPPAAPFIMVGSAMINAALNVTGLALSGITDIGSYVGAIGSAIYQISVVSGVLNNLKSTLGISSKSALARLVNSGYKKITTTVTPAIRNTIKTYINKFNAKISRAPLYNIARDPFVMKKNTIDVALTAFNVSGLNRISKYMLNRMPNFMTRLYKYKKSPSHSMGVITVSNTSGSKLTRIYTGVKEGFNIDSTSLFFKGTGKVTLGSYEFNYTELTNSKGTYLLDPPPASLYTDNEMKLSLLHDIYSNLDGTATLLSGNSQISRSYLETIKPNYQTLTNNDWDNLWNALEKSFVYRYSNSNVVSSQMHNMELDTVRVMYNTAIDNFVSRPYNLLTHNCQHFTSSLNNSMNTGTFTDLYNLNMDEELSTQNLLKNFETYVGLIDEQPIFGLNQQVQTRSSILDAESMLIDDFDKLNMDAQNALLSDVFNPNSQFFIDMNVPYSQAPQWFKELVTLQPADNVRDYISNYFYVFYDLLSKRSNSQMIKLPNSDVQIVSAISMENGITII